MSPQDFLDKNYDPHKVYKSRVGQSFQDIAPHLYDEQNRGFGTYLLRLENLLPGFYSLYGGMFYTSSRLYIFAEDGSHSSLIRNEGGAFSESLEDLQPGLEMKGLSNFVSQFKSELLCSDPNRQR